MHRFSMTKKTQLSFLKWHLDRLTTSICKRLFLEISLENPFKSIKNIKIIDLYHYPFIHPR
jgi:hypothetical protein